MIYELHSEHYDKVKPIFTDKTNHPIINGVIDRNNRGKIYVDDLENPRTTLICAFNEMYYLAGDYNNESFLNSFDQLLFDRIAPEALSMNDPCFQLEAIPHCSWEEKLERLLSHRLLKTYYRLAFEFNGNKYRSLSECQNNIPEGYSIQRINYRLLNEDKSRIISNKILKHWNSIKSFMHNGIGYCVKYNDEIVNICLSVYASNKDIEIGIETFKREHRNKGLGTLCARAMIDYCLESGYTPHWTTENFRYSSKAIAQKLGFENMIEYPCYMIKLDNNLSN